MAKHLELLHEVLPKAAVIGMLVNPNSAGAQSAAIEARAAARILGQEVHILQATSEREIDAAFATLGQYRVDALVIAGNSLFTGRREQLVALAARHAVPTLYYQNGFVEAGGLMSYSASIQDSYRQAGIYAGNILKGAKAAELPVQQPTKFDLVINRKTAEKLGLTIPQSILLRADEVIE